MTKTVRPSPRRLIHEHCERRPHFDAGRFAKEFGDEGHREAGACTTSAVKGQKLMATAQRCNSAMLAVCGRWRLVTRAMAVTKKVSASIKASISLPTSKIRLRVHRNRDVNAKEGGNVSAGAIGLLGGVVGLVAGVSVMAVRELGRSKRKITLTHGENNREQT